MELDWSMNLATIRLVRIAQAVGQRGFCDEQNRAAKWGLLKNPEASTGDFG
jgi:hypothetical protein